MKMLEALKLIHSGHKQMLTLQLRMIYTMTENHNRLSKMEKQKMIWKSLRIRFMS